MTSSGQGHLPFSPSRSAAPSSYSSSLSSSSYLFFSPSPPPHQSLPSACSSFCAVLTWPASADVPFLTSSLREALASSPRCSPASSSLHVTHAHHSDTSFGHVTWEHKLRITRYVIHQNTNTHLDDVRNLDRFSRTGFFFVFLFEGRFQSFTISPLL